MVHWPPFLKGIIFSGILWNRKGRRKLIKKKNMLEFQQLLHLWRKRGGRQNPLLPSTFPSFLPHFLIFALVSHRADNRPKLFLIRGNWMMELSLFILGFWFKMFQDIFWNVIAEIHPDWAKIWKKPKCLLTEWQIRRSRQAMLAGVYNVYTQNIWVYKQQDINKNISETCCKEVYDKYFYEAMQVSKKCGFLN